MISLLCKICHEGEDNAYKNVAKNVKKRNEKIKQNKKNFYKEFDPFEDI